MREESVSAIKQEEERAARLAQEQEAKAKAAGKGACNGS